MLSISGYSLISPLSMFFTSASSEGQDTKHAQANKLDATTLEDTDTRNRKRKAEIIDLDLDCVVSSGKKARLVNSGDEADFSAWDTTFVDADTSIQDKSKSGSSHKAIDPRFDFGADIAFNENNDTIDSVSATSLSLSSSPNPATDTGYDSNNERHEWELCWFVCAHHAAFTAATAMSLRQEIRRRKTILRMWKELKKENTALKREIERLAGSQEIACEGAVGVAA